GPEPVEEVGVSVREDARSGLGEDIGVALVAPDVEKLEEIASERVVCALVELFGPDLGDAAHVVAGRVDPGQLNEVAERKLPDLPEHVDAGPQRIVPVAGRE